MYRTLVRESGRRVALLVLTYDSTVVHAGRSSKPGAPVAGTATATFALGAANAAPRAATAVGYYCTLHEPTGIAL